MSESELVLLSAALTVVFLVAFWFSPAGVLALRRIAGGALQVDLRPGYQPDTLYNLLQAYGPLGIRRFRAMLVADMFFPVVYGATLYMSGDLLAATHPHSTTLTAWIHCAAAGAVTFDYGENLALLAVIQRLPSRSNRRARTAGIFTTSKAASLAAALLALLVGYL